MKIKINYTATNIMHDFILRRSEADELYNNRKFHRLHQVAVQEQYLAIIIGLRNNKISWLKHKSCSVPIVIPVRPDQHAAGFALHRGPEECARREHLRL